MVMMIQSALRNQSANNTLVIQKLLQSADCLQPFPFSNNSNSSSNFTLFLPTDQAFGSLAWLLRSGAISIPCNQTSSSQCTSNPFIALTTENRGSLSALIACSSDILRYHLVPNNTFTVGGGGTSGSNGSTNSSSSNGNVTVLMTALNSTAFVSLNGTGQVLIVNNTQSGQSYVNYGYGRPARIVQSDIFVGSSNDTSSASTISSSDNSTNTSGGVIQLIDTILLPPLPLNVTLQVANLTDFAAALNSTSSDGSMSNNNNNMTGITVFAPINSSHDTATANSNSNTSIDPSQYIIPNQVFYINGTIAQQNITNASNQTIQFSQSQYGSANIIYPNIPIAEGVLHIIDQPIQQQQ
jgi:hypothetical protein